METGWLHKDDRNTCGAYCRDTIVDVANTQLSSHTNTCRIVVDIPSLGTHKVMLSGDSAIRFEIAECNRVFGVFGVMSGGRLT